MVKCVRVIAAVECIDDKLPTRTVSVLLIVIVLLPLLFYVIIVIIILPLGLQLFVGSPLNGIRTHSRSCNYE